MRVLKSLIMFVLLVAALLTVGLFFTPQVILRLVTTLQVPEAIVLVTPQYCSTLRPWLKASSPEVQSLIWPSLHKMAQLETSSFQQKINDPGPMGQLLRLITGKNPDEADAFNQSMSCLHQAMASLSSQYKEIIALFKIKMKGKSEEVQSWQTTLTGACHQLAECAKDLFEEIRQEKDPINRKLWLDTLVGLGDVSHQEALQQLKALPKLGLAHDDTDEPTHLAAEFLTEVFVITQLTKSEKLIEFTNDESIALPLRWRVTSTWAKLEGPRHELWPVAEKVMNDPHTGESCKREALLRFGPLWDSHQDLVLELAKQLQELAERLPSAVAKDAKLAVKEQITVIKGFTSSQREPQAISQPLPGESQQSLGLAVAQLARAMKAKFGQKSDDLVELFKAVEHHPMFADKSYVVTQLFMNPESAEMGMDILLGDNDLDATRINTLRKSFDSLPVDLRVKLSQRSKEFKLISAILPALPPKRTQEIWKTTKPTATLRDALEKWASSSEIHPALRVGFQASALVGMPKGPKLKALNDMIQKDFKCESDWIRTGQNLVQNGPTHPGYSMAVLELLGCPPEQADHKNLGKELLTKLAQKQIKKDLAKNKSATPEQLKRLTDILGMANRVPGSSLPPKIKRPSN